MTASTPSTSSTVLTATLVSGALIAQQVGGKAARDALFLSQFEISALPAMMVASALASILAVKWVLGRRPDRLVPIGLAASGILLLVQWALSSSQPRFVAVALYIHIAVFGSVLAENPFLAGPAGPYFPTPAGGELGEDQA